MLIQLASDLHTEMHRDSGKEAIKSLLGTKADVLVLAGDICSAKEPGPLRSILGLLAPHYSDIIFVPGNHEFHRTDPVSGWRNIMKAASGFPNVHALDNQAIEIGGQRFVCGTGWFPRPSPWGEMAKGSMDDFFQIREFEPWVYEAYAGFRDLLVADLRKEDIVVTHHLPSARSVPSQYEGSSLNAFFVSGFDYFIAEYQPRLWLHGHTHTRCDYTFMETRIVANPLGYPTDGRALMAFDPHLTITV